MRYWKSLAKRAAYVHKANTNYERRRADSNSLFAKDATDIRLERKAEDPGRTLKQTIEDFRVALARLSQVDEDRREILKTLNQAISISISTQQRLKFTYEQITTHPSYWYRKAQLALQNGDEKLCREALAGKQTVNAFRALLDQTSLLVFILKQEKTAIEQFSSTASLKERRQACSIVVEAIENIIKTMSRVDAHRDISAFEHIEEMVRQIESDDDLEIQFASLDAGSDVDAELAMLKVQLAEPPALEGITAWPEASPNAEPVDTPQQQTPIDAELEELRNKLDQI